MVENWTVGGMWATERLMGQVDYYSAGKCARVSPASVAVLLRAIASDPVALAQATKHRPAGADVALSVGRWCHDLGDALEQDVFNSWSIGNQRAADWVMSQIAAQASSSHPYAEQAAVVLHALADYTALQQAVRYKLEGEDQDASLGLWLSDLAEVLEASA